MVDFYRVNLTEKSRGIKQQPHILECFRILATTDQSEPEPYGQANSTQIRTTGSIRLCQLMPKPSEVQHAGTKQNLQSLHIQLNSLGDKTSGLPRGPPKLLTWSKSCLPVVLGWTANSSSASMVVTRTFTCKGQRGDREVSQRVSHQDGSPAVQRK